MKFSQILLQQHLGWHFKSKWHALRKKKVFITPAEKILKSHGIPVVTPEDVLDKRHKFEKIEVVGYKPKPVVYNEGHPDWNERVLFTFKDNNVLLEGLQQAQIITKTVQLKDGLPEKYVKANVSNILSKQVRQSIMNSHVFDAEQEKLPKVKDPQRPAWNFPRDYGITTTRRCQLIISKLLQLIENNEQYNIVRRRHIFNNLPFIYTCEKEADLLQFKLQGDTVLTSSEPLISVTEEPTGSHLLPDLYPIRHTITLNDEHFYKLRNLYPIHSKARKFHPHTVFVHFDKTKVQNVYEEEITENQIYGRSLMKAFTVAASYAQNRFGVDIKTLPRPVTIQCVQTDGRWFHFGVLQLNTLDLENGNEGVKNIWFQTTQIPLFEECSYKLGKPVLNGYNNAVIENLMSFYRNV